MGEVVGVYMYPLKGAQPATFNGQPTESLELGYAGFELEGVPDRGLFFAADDGQGGLAVVTPRGWANDNGPRVVHEDDRNLNAVNTNISPGGLVELEYQTSKLVLPVPELMRPDHQDPVPVRLHGGTVMGTDLGEAGVEFASGVVKRDARLMYGAPRSKHVLKNGKQTDALAADGYPYLLAVQGSLDTLNAREGTDTPMESYRPNMVFDLGEEGFDKTGLLPEDWMLMVEVNRHILEIASASGRCIVTKLRRGEPVVPGLRTIRSRRGVKLDNAGEPIAGKDEEGNFFGVNANLIARCSKNGRVSRRDLVRTLAYRDYPLVRLKTQTAGGQDD